MCSLLVKSFSVNQTNLSRKTIFWCKLSFLVVNVVLSDIRGLKLVIG